MLLKGKRLSTLVLRYIQIRLLNQKPEIPEIEFEKSPFEGKFEDPETIAFEAVVERGYLHDGFNTTKVLMPSQYKIQDKTLILVMKWKFLLTDTDSLLVVDEFQVQRQNVQQEFLLNALQWDREVKQTIRLGRIAQKQKKRDQQIERALIRYWSQLNGKDPVIVSVSAVESPVDDLRAIIQSNGIMQVFPRWALSYLSFKLLRQTKCKSVG